ncbi:endoribonuclease-like protein L-psp [Halenospora varia]|nr:endoribonuclease-like protein L-psp [Halenospora varia]
MSHLTYTNYKGLGERMKDSTWYSQAVRYGNTVECSGQGGWDRETEEIPDDIEAQINRAFDNVEHNLKVAGAKGWEDVFCIRAYFIEMNEESMAAFVAALKKYCPNHQPILTAVGVTKLGIEAMKIEVEVKAQIPADRK